MKVLIGRKSGKKIYATYSHVTGDLPKLRIAGKLWQGSSLGPKNFNCRPAKEDIEFWKVLARDAELVD